MLACVRPVVAGPAERARFRADGAAALSFAGIEPADPRRRGANGCGCGGGIAFARRSPPHVETSSAADGWVPSCFACRALAHAVAPSTPLPLAGCVGPRSDRCDTDGGGAGGSGAGEKPRSNGSAARSSGSCPRSRRIAFIRQGLLHTTRQCTKRKLTTAHQLRPRKRKRKRKKKKKKKKKKKQKAKFKNQHPTGHEPVPSRARRGPHERRARW